MLRIVKNYIVAEEKVAKVARVLLATFSSRNNFCLKGYKAVYSVNSNYLFSRAKQDKNC